MNTKPDSDSFASESTSTLPDAAYGASRQLKAGIAIDAWKLPIFERHLSQSGYAYTTSPGLSADTLLLMVKTTNPAAMYEVVRAANAEAAMTGAPKS